MLLNKDNYTPSGDTVKAVFCFYRIRYKQHNLSAIAENPDPEQQRSPAPNSEQGKAWGNGTRGCQSIMLSSLMTRCRECLPFAYRHRLLEGAVMPVNGTRAGFSEIVRCIGNMIWRGQ